MEGLRGKAEIKLSEIKAASLLKPTSAADAIAMDAITARSMVAALLESHGTMDQ